MIKTGDVIYAKTHATLLNNLLNTNYKQWYKCTYDLDDDTFIWMVYLDGTNNEGHTNKFESDDIIIEEFDKDMIKDKRFEHGLEKPYRLVFEKIVTSNGRKYEFHGLYKLIDTSSNKYKRILKKVNAEYDFGWIYGCK